MAHQKSSTLVLGEAPESDEETEENDAASIVSNSCSKSEDLPVNGSASTVKTSESEDVANIHSTVVSSATEPGVKQEKLNVSTSEIQTAALKKLREENRLLYEGITTFKRQILSSTNYELNNMNQQLLKSQIELQQTLNYTRQVKNNLNNFEKKLTDIVLADYIPRINIKVPKNII